MKQEIHSYNGLRRMNLSECNMSTYSIKKALPKLLLLAAAFFVGRAFATLVNHPFPVSATVTEQKQENWGLGFGKDGTKPTGNATCDEMKKYNAYYMAEGEEKVLYLTFDCGYENGNTGAILDAL